MALERDGNDTMSTSERLSQVRFLRPGLSAAGDPARRLGEALAYDVALVHLCRKFDVEYDLVAAGDASGARRRAEELLADRLPGFAGIVDPPVED